MSTPPSDIRNIAIIAHVDHGKTTLVDAMLRQTGVFRSNEAVVDRVMDSNDLERERGITILAKHASIDFEGVRINIIDTPGHADFGGEVERTLMMADGALLLVDAAEGPLPQTRFVVQKALELGLRVVVVINKVDRQDARADEVLNEVFDLFCDLGATDEQANFPTLYAIAKDGIARHVLDGPDEGLKPLLDTILKEVPAPTNDSSGAFRMRVHNVIHDEYVGRLAVGRVERGVAKPAVQVVRLGEDDNVPGKTGGVFGYVGTQRVKVEEARAGDIVAVSGFEDVQIGDTIADPEAPEALPRISVEEPTIKVRFLVNSSPFAGTSGKWVTSRHLRDRLFKEAKRNLALRVEETDSADAYIVFGRGELMLSVLAETMRREGYELALGMPEVVVREVDGVQSEPVERVVIDVSDDFVGAVTTSLGERKGQMVNMNPVGVGRTRVEFRIPSRGLIGYRSQFLTETRGTGLLNTLFEGWEPWSGPMLRRSNGALVSDRKGKTTPYALFNLQARGKLFVNAGVEVYEGMIIGEHNRANDLDVNATREKKLTNIRAAGRDENVALSPVKPLNIEEAMEWVDQDEVLEITPDDLRIRKKVLQCNRRPKRGT